jgi:hypothetical protein
MKSLLEVLKENGREAQKVRNKKISDITYG